MRFPLRQVSRSRAVLITGCALLLYYLTNFGTSRKPNREMAHSPSENSSSHSHSETETEMEMMPMFFTFENPAHILFKPWSPKTDGEMVGAVFAVFFLAVSFEALKRGRQTLNVMEARRNATATNNIDESMSGVAPSTGLNRVTATARGMFRGFHLLQTLLHGVQFVLAYFLMLAVMTFSVWLFLGMIFGAMFGYFVFQWSPASGGYDSLHNDHCH